MKDKIDELAAKYGMTRREFLKITAQSGMLLGMSSALPGCFNNNTTLKKDDDSPQREKRNYYFDLSHTDEEDEHYLIAGEKPVKLNKCDSQIVKKSGNPLLQAIPEDKVTHHVTTDFPSNELQSCYIRTIKPGDADGVWSMSLSFLHLPTTSVKQAAVRGSHGLLGSSAKLSHYGIDATVFNSMNTKEAYLHEDEHKSFADLAIDVVFSHPELICGQIEAAGHIIKNIISPDPNTFILTAMLTEQGSATVSGGWAILDPYINSETGEPYLNSEGLIQYYTRWSSTTLKYGGTTILSSMKKAKNDVTLGVNITGLDPDSDSDISSTSGKIWKVYNGIPTVEMDATGVETSFDYTFSKKSREHGYDVTLTDFDTETGQVTFLFENWYARYLGIYIRFLDPNGDLLEVSDLTFPPTDDFPSVGEGKEFDCGVDKFALLLKPEFEILGIPIKHAKEEFTFTIPEEAAEILILAGGMGRGTVEYPNTLAEATVCTALINLSVPTVFLVAGAASACGKFIYGLEKEALVRFIIQLADELVIDSIITKSYHDPEVFIEVGKSIGEFMLDQSAEWFMEMIAEYVENEQVENAIPVIGKLMLAIAAVGLATEIIETSAEVGNSPRTYVDKLKLTHDVTVTVYHDPDDPAGFPAVADYYEVLATFDDGTPFTSGKISMPGTTVTSPLVYTFNNSFPYGGKVQFSVQFTSTDNWLAGVGNTLSIDNTVDSVEITIEENKVLLSSSTVYSHKQKIVLDTSGNHIWQATSTSPSANANSLACGSVDGILCNLVGITASEDYATLGYGWKSYSSEVTSCESGGIGQLNQFSSVSFAQNPQDSYLKPVCGFSAPARIAYDLMGSKKNNYYLDTTNGKNLVRQIQLELYGKPSIDKPDSNRCWGSFENPSDAFLLHPSQKIISINTEFNKIEILHLSGAPTTDEKARLAQSYSGPGTREGLVKGPVAAAITKKGAILILESENKRIQAFDLGINPVRMFANHQYFAPLKEETEAVYYVDMVVEHTGYIYVLSYTASFEYRLDIYTPEGVFLSRTTGVHAANLTVDLWRNVYSLNYEVLKMPDGTQPTITEPSISQWIPSVP